MKKSKVMQLGAVLAAMLLLSMAFVPAVSAESQKNTLKDMKYGEKKPIETFKYSGSKPEILINESEIRINALSDPTPSTSGLTLIGSDSASNSNYWGDILSSKRIYQVNNENDNSNDYYVVWIQATAKMTVFDLDWVKVGIKDLTDGQIVDWSPTAATNTYNGQQTTISLGVTVPGASATISQTFSDPTGKISPTQFGTTKFESTWTANPGTNDPGFTSGGVMIKSPAGKVPTFGVYSSAY